MFDESNEYECSCDKLVSSLIYTSMYSESKVVRQSMSKSYMCVESILGMCVYRY